jgi:hypothetical protein
MKPSKKPTTKKRKPRNGMVWKEHGVILETDRDFAVIIPTWPELSEIRAFPNEARKLGEKLIQWADWSESRAARGRK